MISQQRKSPYPNPHTQIPIPKSPYPNPHTQNPKPTLVFAFLALLLGSCINAFLGEDVADTPLNNFDVLWQDIDRYYALFEDKGIDWDSAYVALRPLVQQDDSGEGLFEVMCQMLRLLDDGHLTVETGSETCSGRRPKGDASPALNLRTVERFLEAPFQTAGEGRLRYGRIANRGKIIGYLHIQNFTGAGAPIADWVSAIDGVLETLAGDDALILDIRDNGGGNGFNAGDLAGRFTDIEYPYLISQTRNGPDHTDLSRPQTWYVEPRGKTPYAKPVALLTNRGTFSAAEWFTLALQSRPGVTVIGDLTGGGLSSRIFRTLPNGWSFSVSIQRVTDIEGFLHESTGIEPDIPVSPDSSPPVVSDRILVAAIEHLSSP